MEKIKEIRLDHLRDDSTRKPACTLCGDTGWIHQTVLVQAAFYGHEGSKNEYAARCQCNQVKELRRITAADIDLTLRQDIADRPITEADFAGLGRK